MPGIVTLSVTAAAYGGAVASGFAASLLHVPLPWMIGPLLFTAVFSLFRRDFVVPDWSRPAGQVVVAAVVGLSFTPEAVSAIADHFVLLILVSTGTIAAGCLAAVVLARLARIDPMVALISSIPGGPAEMSALALSNGVPAGPVVIVQTMRVALLVLLVPPVVVALSDPISWSADLFERGAAPAWGPLLLAAIALSGSVVFFLLRLTSPFFLGSLAFTAIASALTLPVSMPPFWMLAAAQVLLGTWLGKTIDRQLRDSGRRFILSAFASTAVLIVCSVAIALAVSHTVEISWQTMILATAPGSVTEMALTARLLHQDVAMVTAFQVVRIFIVMPLAPFAFARLARRFRRRDAGE